MICNEHTTRAMIGVSIAAMHAPRRLLSILLAGLILVQWSPILQAGSTTTPAHTNHLAGEKSPYLLQHAHNPVDWYPWGPEAFEKAKRENKPIFLSVGYSTCHWCHVMERESFEDQATARLLNDWFVSIKVDREERPDVDRVYMTFVQATTGSGGWPMSVFLTPELKPFWGATYFPAEAQDGLPAFKTVLTRIHDAWDKDHARVVESAEKVTAALRDLTRGSEAGQGGIEGVWLDRAFTVMKGEFDAAHGGFGAAPKFPEPVRLNFLMRYWRRSGELDARDMVLKTLRAMAAGGMHDQIGGGFHRYSTDDRWFLPHFEKMLYDQAQLACAYLEAYQATHDPFFDDVTRDILDYVLRDMTGPDGQFYSAEDADSAIDPQNPDQKGEGAFYVWTADEIERALGNEASRVFAYRYGVEPDGNVKVDPRGEFARKNVLYLAHSPEATAEKLGTPRQEVERIVAQARQALMAVRSKRPRPLRDDKTITAWNGLMISAFARAGAALDEDRYRQAAARAAAFAREHLYDPKSHRLLRRWRDGRAAVDGFLDDYAFLTHGLIDLYETTFDVRWLKLAIDLQSRQDELFADPAGGYFSTAAADTSVLLRVKEDADGAEPAGNSVAAMNLLRLGQMTDDKGMFARADKTIASAAARLRRSPTAMSQMLAAVDFALHKPKQIVLAATPASPDLRELENVIWSRFVPDKVVMLADGAQGQSFLADRLPFLKDVTPLHGRATAYVCENYACQAPTNNPNVLEGLLDRPAATQPARGRE